MLEFWLCFVPLFAAVDAIGVLPLFINLTYGIERSAVKKIIRQSTITATIAVLVFLAVGKIILNLIGITTADFMIAGGALLFIFSLNDMLTIEKKQLAVDPDSLGAVPIGVPLIVGPAVLTTTILLVGEYGFAMTALAAIVNVLIAGFMFSISAFIERITGKAGAKTLSKLASLILAAIAVMMIRKGINIFISSGFSAKI